MRQEIELQNDTNFNTLCVYNKKDCDLVDIVLADYMENETVYLTLGKEEVKELAHHFLRLTEQ